MPPTSTGRARGGRVVLPAVREDVHERVADRPRRVEGSRVEAVSPDRTAPSEDAGQRAGDADREAPKTAAEGSAVIGLDQEMKMVILNTERDDSEVVARGRSEHGAHRGEDAFRSQAANGRTRAQRDV